MQEWSTALVQYWRESIEPFLNSNFITSLIGAGAGAWAGAYAAQRIAARAKSRDDLVREIRSTNAAFNLAVMILNLSIGLKRQHVKRLKEDYDAKHLELLEVMHRRESGESNASFEFSGDFQTLAPISTPIDELQTLLFDNISPNTRTVVFGAILLQSINSLNNALVERIRLVEEFRRIAAPTQGQVLRFYFGLPDNAGNVDNRYGSAIVAISQYTDDCIFFSKSIADGLTKHGKALQTDLTKSFKGKAPLVGFIKIEGEDAKLIPDSKNYSSWDKLGTD